MPDPKEIPYASLPRQEEKTTVTDAKVVVIPSGAEVIVGDYRGGIHASIKNPLDNGDTSVLTFALTKEAAYALLILLEEKAEQWEF